ncbi:hypothetical protein H0A66_15895 [Alcaligenaceae bacterium]|nr:hypothetical protein [Alcaligenaceae bacterium]
MHYIIQILAAILTGTAIGAILGQRNTFLLIGSIIAIALGVYTIATASWVPLVVGTAIFLLAQATQRDPAAQTK